MGWKDDPEVANLDTAPAARPRWMDDPEHTEGESPGVLGTVADIAKSGGIGLVQGGLGLLGLPGNIEQIGRSGIDYVAGTHLGDGTALPTSHDLQKGIESVTGEFYKPKTTAGEYARTIGEFAPVAAFGGPAATATSRVASVLLPAVTSETAGQATKGTPYEGVARFAGALAGPMLPHMAMRSVTPITNDVERAAHVANLEHEGVNAITAGQRTGNRAVRWAESAAQDLPFNGGRGAHMMTEQAEQFTQAALRHAGINAARATPEVIDDAFTALGNQFDTLAANHMVTADRGFINSLGQAWRDYSAVVPQSHRAPVVENTIRDIMDTLQRTGGTIAGDAYQALRSRLDKLGRNARISDPQLSGALFDIRNSLDDAMGRGLPANVQATWQNLRGNYRDLLAIAKAMEGAGENTAMGLISPSQLRNAVKGQNGRAYVRGQRDLGELARSGEALLKPLPNSGTPARQAFQNIVNAAGAVVGGAVGSGPGAAIGLVAPSVAQGTMARILMSRPMQRWLSNQRLAPAIERYGQQRAPLLANAPSALIDDEDTPALHGGIGPRYNAGVPR